MGLCYSLRSRLAAAHPSAPYGSRGEPDTPAAAEHGDPQVRHRLRQDLVAKERADKKRSKSIDKTLKAEKREYKQTHRLLLLGERGGAVRPGPARQVRGPRPLPVPGRAEGAAAAGAPGRGGRARGGGAGRGLRRLGGAAAARGQRRRGLPCPARGTGAPCPAAPAAVCGRSRWPARGKEQPQPR